ncbi:MAG TPA: hypothetical protein VK604_20540 [Bryobacteraceae bacterium]|nr:hypothetical protein [Bryobacteraceae bacterium]
MHDYFERELAAGASPETTTRAALGVERVTEECRHARGTGQIEDGIKDLQFAFRTMRRTPTFTMMAMATLALVRSGITIPGRSYARHDNNTPHPLKSTDFSSTLRTPASYETQPAMPRRWRKFAVRRTHTSQAW